MADKPYGYKSHCYWKIRSGESKKRDLPSRYLSQTATRAICSRSKAPAFSWTFDVIATFKVLFSKFSLKTQIRAEKLSSEYEQKYKTFSCSRTMWPVELLIISFSKVFHTLKSPVLPNRCNKSLKN